MAELSALDIVGIALLLSGLFMIVASFGILEVAQINVPSGLKTFMVGMILVGFGGILLSDELRFRIPGIPDITIWQPSKNSIEISIIYAPDEESYMVDAIKQFNQTYREGRNPLTGERLTKDERPIVVKGEPGSSGTIAQAIINAVIAPNNKNVAKPTIFSPSVSHWLALVNYQTGRSIFDLGDSPATALAPVVMAIWESRLTAIHDKNGGAPVGWEELLAVFNSPNGWADYGIRGGRTTVYYGHTDPFISSTALSTLISEFSASARYHGDNPDFRRLTLAQVNDPKVQQGVREIENLIRHYSARTTEFKEYIAQGPDYLDFVALEENDLIFINQGKTAYHPPEKLVALYPKEGTFWHEHPFAIPQTNWVTNEQREAATVFTQFIRSEAIQKKVLENGFRPVDTDIVPLGYPIVPALGVEPNQPTRILEMPEPEVVANVQLRWQLVKKQADVLLLIDNSQSMLGDKLNQAKKAAHVFLDKMPSQNRVGLISFNTKVNRLVPLALYESNQNLMRQELNKLQAVGSTALYDAISQAIDILKNASNDDQKRMKAVVVLSDGQDTISKTTLPNVLSIARHEDRNSVIVIPVAYGSDADIHALNSIARDSATRVHSGDPKNIQKVFEIIGSYF
jgi:Ca-activated chloride channel family protein